MPQSKNPAIARHILGLAALFSSVMDDDMMTAPVLSLPPAEYDSYMAWKRKNMTYGFFAQNLLTRQMKQNAATLSICADVDGQYHPVNVVGSYAFVNGLHQYYFNTRCRTHDFAATIIEVTKTVVTLDAADMQLAKVRGFRSATQLAAHMQQHDKTERDLMAASYNH
jgi:hypothetical protein